MYGENLKDDHTWWQRHKDNVYGTILGLSVLLAVGGVIIICTNNPHANMVVEQGWPANFNQELTEELATAKCGEYNMEWLQYTDASLVYKNRHTNEEAVLYCVDRETKVTVREMIPLMFNEDDKK